MFFLLDIYCVNSFEKRRARVANEGLNACAGRLVQTFYNYILKPRYSQTIPFVSNKFSIIGTFIENLFLRRLTSCFSFLTEECSFYPMVDLWFQGYVAFESVEKAAHYLRLKNGHLVLDHYVGSDTFKQEASFFLKKTNSHESKLNLHFICQNSFSVYTLFHFYASSPYKIDFIAMVYRE